MEIAIGCKVNQALFDLSSLAQMNEPKTKSSAPLLCPDKSKIEDDEGRNISSNNRNSKSNSVVAFSSETETSLADFKLRRTHRGGVDEPFPEKLHRMLSDAHENGFSHIVSWQPHGRCFVVHKPNLFVEKIMPRYFRQTKFPSFLRQLNLYDFNRFSRGRDIGGYYHQLFLRGKPVLCHQMRRVRGKKDGPKANLNPALEPNFYEMPRVEEEHQLGQQTSGKEKNDLRIESRLRSAPHGVVGYPDYFDSRLLASMALPSQSTMPTMSQLDHRPVFDASHFANSAFWTPGGATSTETTSNYRGNSVVSSPIDQMAILPSDDANAEDRNDAMLKHIIANMSFEESHSPGGSDVFSLGEQDLSLARSLQGLLSSSERTETSPKTYSKAGPSKYEHK